MSTPTPHPMPDMPTPLPPLPEPHRLSSETDDGLHHYTSEQMRSYAAAAVAAERERWHALLSGARRIAESNAKRADDCGVLSRALLDALGVLRA